MALMTAGKGSRTSPEKLKPANDEHTTATRHTIMRRPTKDCVDYVVGGLDSYLKIVGERHLEVLQLLGESLK